MNIRSIGNIILFTLLYTLLYVLALALSIGAFFGLAFVTTRVTLMGIVALGIFVGSAGLLSSLIATKISKKNTRALMAGIWAILVLPPVMFIFLTVFRPIASEEAVIPSRPYTQYWDLPTGSRISYSRIEAVGSPKPYPLVYLHGGPGSAVSPTEYAFYSQLAADGFNVYVYDQVGSGSSERLGDMKEYTVKRYIDDLEAIRQEIGADKLILASQSWGGVLATRYMAAHPERVAKSIFVSPGELWDLDRFPLLFERTANAAFPEVINPPIRFFVALVLTRINPNAAQNLLSQAEIANYMESLPAILLNAQNYCLEDVRNVPKEGTVGINPYVNQLVQRDKAQLPDPRPILKSITTPILVIHGECDFIPLEARKEYAETFPNATLVTIPRSGHAIISSQPLIAKDLIKAFLLDEPLPQVPKDKP